MRTAEVSYRLSNIAKQIASSLIEQGWSDELVGAFREGQRVLECCGCTGGTRDGRCPLCHKHERPICDEAPQPQCEAEQPLPPVTASTRGLDKGKDYVWTTKGWVAIEDALGDGCKEQQPSPPQETKREFDIRLTLEGLVEDAKNRGDLGAAIAACGLLIRL